MDFQCVFWNGRTEKHQTSTARFRLAEENGQHRPFPSLACVLPHPLQNRVPRGERAPVALCCEPTEPAGETKSFCPCQKSQVSLVRYLTFFVSVRKDLATRCARRPACGACRGGLQPGGLRPGPTEAAAETSPSLDFLLAFRVFSSGFTRSQLFPSSPAPKTHPVSPFSAQTGCVFSIFAVFWLQNFCPSFCASCRIAFTD